MKPIFMSIAFALAVLANEPTLAHTAIYEAILNGPSESPANASSGTGTALVTFDLDLATMRVQVDFTGLGGTVTASHIHCCTALPGVSTIGVATVTPTFTGFPSGVTAGSYDHTFDLALAGSYNAAFITANGGTVSGAMNALLFGAQDGKAYLNIHTTTFGGGEIRGFLQAVPIPPAIWLLGSALLGLVAFKRRGTV